MPSHDYTFIGEGANPRHQSFLRRILSLSVVGFFLVFLLARGISKVADGSLGVVKMDLEAYASGKTKVPDFGQYVHSRTLRFDDSLQGNFHLCIYIVGLNAHIHGVIVYRLEPTHDRCRRYSRSIILTGGST